MQCKANRWSEALTGLPWSTQKTVRDREKKSSDSKTYTHTKKPFKALRIWIIMEKIIRWHTENLMHRTGASMTEKLCLKIHQFSERFKKYVEKRYLGDSQQHYGKCDIFMNEIVKPAGFFICWGQNSMKVHVCLYIRTKPSLHKMLDSELSSNLKGTRSWRI